MVLLSGTQNTGAEAKTAKEKSEIQPFEDEKDGKELPNVGNLEESGENIYEEESLQWQGSGDPLPQLLAIVPSLENCMNKCKTNFDVDEEVEDYDDYSDTRSIASDDSFYPPDIERKGYWQNGEESNGGDQYESTGYDSDSFQSLASPEPLSVFKACSSNNAIILKALMRQGLTAEEVCETDRNNRTGLLVACYQGYVDIVIALSQCPHVDVNWQDNEGNTALITAAQAGHITITNHLLNYFPGLDLEKRNIHGFTALMKASIQGRTDCVRALMLAGADIYAVDPNRGYTSREWARFTGRYDTDYLMQRLLDKPCPEQFRKQFIMEWPNMKVLLAKAAEPKTCAQRLSECFKSAFTFNYFNEPEEDGVIDHMVKITTSMNSPFVAIGCRTVCPDSPPCVGKHRYSVQEILIKQKELETSSYDINHKITKSQKLFNNIHVTAIQKKKERRVSLQTSTSQRTTVFPTRRKSILPVNLVRRSSVRPGHVIPKVRISKAPTPTYYPDKVKKKSNVHDNTYLQIPKWRYKEIKEERRKAEEAALRKLEETEKQKQKSPIKKRTFT